MHTYTHTNAINDSFVLICENKIILQENFDFGKSSQVYVLI